MPERKDTTRLMIEQTKLGPLVHHRHIVIDEDHLPAVVARRSNDRFQLLEGLSQDLRLRLDIGVVAVGTPRWRSGLQKEVVRKGGLEPPRFYPPDPKLSRFAGVSDAPAERESAGEILSERSES